MYAAVAELHTNLHERDAKRHARLRNVWSLVDGVTQRGYGASQVTRLQQHVPKLKVQARVVGCRIQCAFVQIPRLIELLPLSQAYCLGGKQFDIILLTQTSSEARGK